MSNFHALRDFKKHRFDPALLRENDTIAVLMRVHFVHSSEDGVRVAAAANRYATPVFVDNGQIIACVGREFSPGEKVLVRYGGSRGPIECTVLSAAGDHLWVKTNTEDVRPVTVHVSDVVITGASEPVLAEALPEEPTPQPETPPLEMPF